MTTVHNFSVPYKVLLGAIASGTVQLVKKPNPSVLCNRNIIEPPLMFDGINLVFSKCTLNRPIYSISVIYQKDFGTN